jgi:hypothetical protein
MYLHNDQITDRLHKRRFLYGNVELNAACSVTPHQQLPPPSPQLKPAALQDIYRDIETLNEGID